MSAGFGLSAGEFITAINLVSIVIDVLRSNGNAGTEYRELVNQLLCLETTLLQVQKLDFEESQYQEVIALKQAAAQCRTTIDGFWDKARKYQPWLGNSNGSSKRNLKEGWMKIKWAVCKKEDVAKFRTDLMGHTQSITLLLAAVQKGSDNIRERKQDAQHESITGKVQEGYLNCMQRINTLLEQGKGTFQVVATILYINVRVFQVVLFMLDVLTKSLPRQIERQQPVYLIDALERHCPFHLEFIRCSDAFLSVLRINFQRHGNGARKIDRREFAIQDTATKRDINLEADWDRCFHPGQRVNMSMIFWKKLNSRTEDPDHHLICPRCQLIAEDNGDGGFLECLRCGMSFQRELKEEKSPNVPTSRSDDLDDIDLQLSLPRSLQAQHAAMISNLLEDETSQDDPEPDGDDPTIFQRVRIIENSFSSLRSFESDIGAEYIDSGIVQYPLLSRQSAFETLSQDTTIDRINRWIEELLYPDSRGVINQWLLNHPRFTPSDLNLFERVTKNSMLSTMPSKGREQQVVLHLWYQDESMVRRPINDYSASTTPAESTWGDTSMVVHNLGPEI